MSAVYKPVAVRLSPFDYVPSGRFEPEFKPLSPCEQLRFVPLRQRVLLARLLASESTGQGRDSGLTKWATLWAVSAGLCSAVADFQS